MAQQANTSQISPFGPTYYLGLPYLIDRPRYRPHGFARPILIFYWVGGLMLAWFFAEHYWPFERFNERHSTAGHFMNYDDVYAWAVIPFFIYTLPMFGFGYLTIKGARVQRPWINSLLHFTWAGSFMAHAFYVHRAEWLPVGASLCVSMWSVPFIGLIAFYVADRYTRPIIRIFYPAGGGHWATEFKAFFNAQPQDVWAALENGDADFLKACRSEGPTRVTHEFFPRLPEQTTALIISTCPELKGQKAYLFLKTYFGYRFSQRMVRATVFGITMLRDVELTEGDLKKLSKLIPGFTRDLHTGAQGNAYEPKEQENILGYSGPPTHRAESPNGSWLGWVGKDEIRSFGTTSLINSMFCYLLLAVFLAAVCVCTTWISIFVFGKTAEAEMVAKWLLIIPLIMATIYITRKPRPPKRLARAVASRRERLFTPDASTSTLLVQPLESYGRFKTSKQFAMARVRPDGLDLEFGKFRARLSAADIQLDLVKAMDKTMLVLNARLARGSWRVVIDDATPKSAKDPSARAQDLKSQWESAWAKNGVSIRD